MSSSGLAPGANRALCVVRDPALRRTLRRTLTAAGSPVEFRESIDQIDVQPGTLLFIDSECRDAAELTVLAQMAGVGGRIVILRDSLADPELLEMLQKQPLDHLISDSEVPDEMELVVTSVKLLSGDIFGLEKYLSWGARVTEVELSTYEEKRAALADLGRVATEVGARRQLVTKIESSADELLMNALYDAPATRADDGAGPPPPKALLRYASDGRHFAVSVLDRYGALDKRTILDSVARARAESGKPKVEGRGAGLGLYFVMASVTRFIANIQPGERTEVVCLFDLRERGRDAGPWARSLHIFTSNS